MLGRRDAGHMVRLTGEARMDSWKEIQRYLPCRKFDVLGSDKGTRHAEGIEAVMVFLVTCRNLSKSWQIGHAQGSASRRRAEKLPVSVSELGPRRGSVHFLPTKSYICVRLTLTLVCELTPSSGLPLCRAESENRSTNRPIRTAVLPKSLLLERLWVRNTS